MISSYLLMMDFETVQNAKIMYPLYKRVFNLTSCLYNISYINININITNIILTTIFVWSVSSDLNGCGNGWLLEIDIFNVMT